MEVTAWQSLRQVEVRGPRPLSAEIESVVQTDAVGVRLRLITQLAMAVVSCAAAPPKVNREPRPLVNVVCALAVRAAAPPYVSVP